MHSDMGTGEAKLSPGQCELSRRSWSSNGVGDRLLPFRRSNAMEETLCEYGVEPETIKSSSLGWNDDRSSRPVSESFRYESREDRR